MSYLAKFEFYKACYGVGNTEELYHRFIKGGISETIRFGTNYVNKQMGNNQLSEYNFCKVAIYVIDNLSQNGSVDAKNAEEFRKTGKLEGIKITANSIPIPFLNWCKPDTMIQVAQVIFTPDGALDKNFT